MDNNQDLKYIKKHYGESFERMCRRLFPTILEEPGALTKIISEHFDPTATLFDDILDVEYEFKNFVYSIYHLEKRKELQKIIKKSPEQLFKEAGYKLYPECKNFKDILKFKKYYALGEELCTFRDERRLNSCRVWFAVKDDVDKINRENFKIPLREDRYGTSVISIQFSCGTYTTLSIKNRYNHAVSNPDATFSNDLDNIIPGLTASFCNKYDIDLSTDYSIEFGIPGYVRVNGKFYKSIIDHCYTTFYCENNYVYDNFTGELKQYDKSKFLLVDSQLIDLQNKKIISLVKEDSFADTIGEIKNIDVYIDDKKNKIIDITPKIGKKIQIVANSSSEIIKYSNPNITKITNNFMYLNRECREVYLPNIEEVGNDFLHSNFKLEEVNFPKLKKIGDNFLCSNSDIAHIYYSDLPNVEEIGNGFLSSNREIFRVDLPELRVVGNSFLLLNYGIDDIDFPNLEKIGDGFIRSNSRWESVNLPKVKQIGDDFLLECSNAKARKLSLPNVTKIGSSFLKFNGNLREIDLPNVTEIGDNFLYYNYELKKINIPKIEHKGENFLFHYNKKLKEKELNKNL